MNVLFLTIARINSLYEKGIYTDLLREFQKAGHNVFVVSPIERREKTKTNLLNEELGSILNIRTLNIQKTNIIEKGIGTIIIEYQFLMAIKTFFSGIKFDLILYSTPPITFVKVINFIKERDQAYSYLLLKDIFPQNAVDMGMLKKGGFLYNYFRKKEHRLYEISDTIGCMSEANKEYILANNASIPLGKLEVNPNSICVNATVINKDINEVRIKFGLTLKKRVFVYGGNLGKPQGIDFLIETITATHRQDVYFLIIGSGTEYGRIEKWFNLIKPQNAKLLKALPKNDFEMLLSACDVGMLFLHKDFTIPNFPSRLLSYLENKLPVIAATDPNTDVGIEIENAACGFSVLWGDQVSMQDSINKLCSDEMKYITMKENAYDLLITKYNVRDSYQKIIEKFSYV